MKRTGLLLHKSKRCCVHGNRKPFAELADGRCLCRECWRRLMMGDGRDDSWLPSPPKVAR